MSRQELAEAVNSYLWVTYAERVSLDANYVGKLESGKTRWPRARYREAFRCVLGAATDAELGFFIVRGHAMGTPAGTGRATGRDAAGEDDDVERRQLLACIAAPSLGALITTVTAALFDVGQPPERAVVDLDAVARRLALAHRAYQHGRYAAAAQLLPAVLTQLRCGSERAGSRVRLATLSAEAHQVASALLLKGEQPVFAAIAAERSVAAAQASGDALTLASSMRGVVHGLMAAGHADRAQSVATRAAQQLADAADMDAPTTLSLYGALMLRGAIAAARHEDRAGSTVFLDEADRAAGCLGADRNLYWTAFGPTNVAAHRVAAAVELGDAGTAVSLASHIDLNKLDLPERKAMLLLDTARALSQWGKWDRALDAIRRAEGHAPEEVRARPAAHQLINDLAHRTPAPLRRRVQEYARQVGAAT